MSKVTFVDKTGASVIGVVAFKNDVPVAADPGLGAVKLQDDGAYVFKLIGFEDKQANITGDVELVMEESMFTLGEIAISDFYQHKTWLLALWIVLLGVSMKKVME